MSDVVVLLRDIGPSSDIRILVAQVEVTPKTIALVLDKPRILRITKKIPGSHELIVHAKDGRTTVILYLPYQDGARASAKIITPTKDEGS